MRNLNETNEQRSARIAEIRRQIAAGTYGTPEKLARALHMFIERQHAGTGSEEE
jgi:anti-sigma28 factor (negative regulator of flagellin synthesis)